MTRPVDRAIVCEGPDDLGVLREMVNKAASTQGLTERVKGQKWERRKGLRLETPNLLLSLVAAGGAKSDLARQTLDTAEGKAITRPDMIGVVFDPDKDSSNKEFEFFIKDYNKLSRGERRGSTLQSKGNDHIVNINRREVTILHAAWRADSPVTFDKIPDEHDLERVLIGGILDAYRGKDIAGWAEESTTKLIDLVKDHGWKRAFRIWNAALEPKAESFADKLLQSKDTKSACMKALQSTPVANMIHRMLTL